MPRDVASHATYVATPNGPPIKTTCTTNAPLARRAPRLHSISEYRRSYPFAPC
jgi:hypothetical protein